MPAQQLLRYEPPFTPPPLGRVGMTICYDMRFPGLHRALAEAGASILLSPAAFTVPTGRAHWEVLLRARAIESQAFVVAPAQWGQHSPDRSSYGRSLIVDPWGLALARAPDGPGVIFSDCDLDAQDRTRRTLPVLAHRRL